MFYDDCGNKFNTVEDIENFARNEFYNLNGDELAELAEDYVTTLELLTWIFKNAREKFMQDYKNILGGIANDYVKDYFYDHDIEEM